MLKDIAQKDFWPEALAHYGFTPSIYNHCTGDMHPALKEQVDRDIKTTATRLKWSAVAHYAISDEGQEEIRQLRFGLPTKIEQVLLHRDAVVLSQKLNREAGSEILKKDGKLAELLVFEIFIKNAFVPAEKAREADEMLKTTIKEIASVKPEDIAYTLCENPIWFHEMFDKLNMIDRLYAEAMPKKQFPADEKIKELKKVIMGPDWTPETSGLAFIETLKQECQLDLNPIENLA